MLIPDNKRVQTSDRQLAPARKGSPRTWKLAWIALAIAYAVPLAWHAYGRLTEVDRQARARLIEAHRLWELQPGYSGNPDMWTRIASRLLNDKQLMSRLAAKYGALAEPIELDYRRDLAIARGEVAFRALALWVLPLGAVYGAARLAARRKSRLPPPKAQPASALDPRYRPPQADD